MTMRSRSFAWQGGVTTYVSKCLTRFLRHGAWLSLTKVALLPDWSITCVKGVVYELINSGFQLEDGGSIASVHVADETDILQRIEEGDEVKAYLVSVSKKLKI